METGNHSIDLTESNFKMWLQENNVAFVNMFAPWCVWCQRLAPTWETFAQEVKKLDMPIGVGKVDCMAQSKLCRTEELMAYPTIRWYRNGEAIFPDFEMDRTVQELMKFAHRIVAMNAELNEGEKELSDQDNQMKLEMAVLDDDFDIDTTSNDKDVDEDESDDELERPYEENGLAFDISISSNDFPAVQPGIVLSEE